MEFNVTAAIFRPFATIVEWGGGGGGRGGGCLKIIT